MQKLVFTQTQVCAHVILYTASAQINEATLLVTCTQADDGDFWHGNMHVHISEGAKLTLLNYTFLHTDKSYANADDVCASNSVLNKHNKNFTINADATNAQQTRDAILQKIAEEHFNIQLLIS